MSRPPTDNWTQLGPLYVTREAAESAAREGRAVRVYPEGMEALASAFPFFTPGDSGPRAMRERESYVGVQPEAGVVDYDSNPRLPPHVWRGDGGSIGICDQMLREDAVCAAIKASWALPIIRSAWSVEPNGDDRHALEMAEFVRANFWEYMRGGWQSFIEQAVGCLHRGFSLFEIVVKYDKDLGRTRLDQLSPILPRTVFEWGRYEDGRWGLTQLPYVGDPRVGDSGFPAFGDYVNLPPDKILHFPWNPDGDNPEGLSVLRPCYGGWKQRRLYLKLEAAGFERGAFGIPYVQVAPNARVGDSADVNAILRELRTGSRAWATLPPGYELKFADFPMKGADLREARIAAGKDMARSALAQFLFTGEAAGAYALVRGHQDFFQMALQSAADMIGGILSQGPHSLVKRLCLWNFDGIKSTPTITPGAISIGDPEKLVTALNVAATAGILSPDSGIEEAVRSALGLPEMPEETAEQWRHRLLNSSPTEVREVIDSSVTEVDVSSPSPLPRPDASDVTDEQKDRVEEEGDALEAMAEPKKRTAMSGRPLRVEELAVRLDETLEPMQSTKEAMALAIQAWRERVGPQYAAQAAVADDLTQIRSIKIPQLGRLKDNLVVELRRAYQAGQEAVRSEIERIGKDPEVAEAVADMDFTVTRDEVVVELPGKTETLGDQTAFSFADSEPCCGATHPTTNLADEDEVQAPKPARKVKAKKPAADGDSVTDGVDPEKVIADIASSTAMEAADRMAAEAIRAAQAASIGGVMEASAVGTAIEDALSALAISKDLVTAQRDANTVFGLGRIQEARAEDAEWGVYSTMLESQSCDPCMLLDGKEFLMSEIDQYATPNPECLGGDLCNCLYLFFPTKSGS